MQALDLASRFNDRVLVTGSLFLVGETLAILASAPASLQTSNQ
jgi:folylpolyglutamate synthase/dihydropteroate synthase